MMKRMYVTRFSKRISPQSLSYLKGVIDGYFYPDRIYGFDGWRYIGVTTTPDKYDSFVKMFKDLVIYTDKLPVEFDIFGGTYE